MRSYSAESLLDATVLFMGGIRKLTIYVGPTGPVWHRILCACEFWRHLLYFYIYIYFI